MRTINLEEERQYRAVKEAARAYANDVQMDANDTLYSVVRDAYIAGALQHAIPQEQRVTAFTTPVAPAPSRAPLFDTTGMVPIRHLRGEHPCGGVAFYHHGPINKNVTADVSRLRTHPDGLVPSPTQKPLCGTCGMHIDPYSNQDLYWPNESLEPTPVAPVSWPGTEGVAAAAYPADVPPPSPTKLQDIDTLAQELFTESRRVPPASE
jgi:hypothetical protein